MEVLSPKEIWLKWRFIRFRTVQFWILETFREQFIAKSENEKDWFTRINEFWYGPGNIIYKICWNSVKGEDDPYLFDDWCDLCMEDNTKEKTRRIIEDMGSNRARRLLIFGGSWLLLYTLRIPRFMNHLSRQWVKLRNICIVIILGFRICHDNQLGLGQSIRIVAGNIKKYYFSSNIE